MGHMLNRVGVSVVRSTLHARRMPCRSASRLATQTPVRASFGGIFSWQMAGLASGSALVLTFGALSSCDGAPPSKSGSDEEWMTTASGLQIQELSPGNGDPAKKGQTVFVHYTGYIMSPNGWEIFDSSRARNGPLEFPLGASMVISGWDEGVCGMKVGGRRMLVIPAVLAYGSSGRPPTIPPNSTLVFDVELVDLKAPVIKLNSNFFNSFWSGGELSK